MTLTTSYETEMGATMASTYYRKRSGLPEWAVNIIMPLVLGYLGVAWVLAVITFVVAAGGLSLYQFAERNVALTPVHNLGVAWDLLTSWPAGTGLGLIGLVVAIVFYSIGA